MILSLYMHLVFAGLAPLAVGYVWYHPMVFGAVWNKLANVPPQWVERHACHKLTFSIGIWMAGVLFAYTMAQCAGVWGVYNIPSAIRLAVWMWIGLIAPVSLIASLRGQEPPALSLINALYLLASVVSMAVILMA